MLGLKGKLREYIKLSTWRRFLRQQQGPWTRGLAAGLTSIRLCKTLGWMFTPSKEKKGRKEKGEGKAEQ